VFVCVPELKKSTNTVKTGAYKHLHGLSCLPFQVCGQLAVVSLVPEDLVISWSSLDSFPPSIL
jgi:hypothetical protein